MRRQARHAEVSPSEPSDAELVERGRAGDDAAFASLMTRHERRIFNLAYRMLGRSEDARDATQEAFLSCYRNLGSFRGQSAFSTWLHRIAVNACFDQLRRHTPIPGLDESRAAGEALPDPADVAATAVDVQRALQAVPAEFRVALVLHDVHDMSIEDVAAVLDVPAGTVKSRVHRGRLALVHALGASDDRREAFDRAEEPHAQGRSQPEPEGVQGRSQPEPETAERRPTERSP